MHSQAWRGVTAASAAKKKAPHAACMVVFDIGAQKEMPGGTDECLDKLFTYSLCGCAVLFNDKCMTGMDIQLVRSIYYTTGIL
jgi:hypothetical protein